MLQYIWLAYILYWYFNIVTLLAACSGTNYPKSCLTLAKLLVACTSTSCSFKIASPTLGCISRYHSIRAQSLVYKVPGSHTDTHTLWCSLAQKSKTGKYLFFPVLVEFMFVVCALVCVLCMCECVFDTRRSVTTELIQSMPIFRAWPRYHAVDKLPVHRGMMWAEPLHWTCTLKHTLTQSAVRIYISGHCTVRMWHAVGPFSFKSSSCINFELTL